MTKAKAELSYVFTYSSFLDFESVILCFNIWLICVAFYYSILHPDNELKLHTFNWGMLHLLCLSFIFVKMMNSQFK